MDIYKDRVVYTADDEEPDCGICTNQDCGFCDECGPACAWHYYERVEYDNVFDSLNNRD